MAYTLFQATLDLAILSGRVIDGTATGGSTTTLDDTNKLGKYGADHFIGSVLWIRSGTYANTWKEITDSNPLVSRVTFAALAGSIVAGNTYSLSWPTVTLDGLKRALNNSLRKIDQPTAEDTSLTTVDNQEDYTLPANVDNILQVQIANSTASPYTYGEYQAWDEDKAAGTLRFDWGRLPPGGYKIRLIYATDHTELTAASDTLPEHFERNFLREYLLWDAAVEILRNRMKYGEGIDPLLTNQYNEAIAMQADLKKGYHPQRLARRPRFPGW